MSILPDGQPSSESAGHLLLGMPWLVLLYNERVHQLFSVQGPIAHNAIV